MSSSITSSEPARSPARRYVSRHHRDRRRMARRHHGGERSGRSAGGVRHSIWCRRISTRMGATGRCATTRPPPSATTPCCSVVARQRYDRALLAGRLGVRNVANFSVPFGLLTDHLPALEFLLRDKAARGGRLAAVFLLIDADFFGKAPWTNVNIDSFLPPQISGESAFRFWWRYLTAFQFKHWKNDLGFLARGRPTAGPGAADGTAQAGGGGDRSAAAPGSARRGADAGCRNVPAGDRRARGPLGPGASTGAAGALRRALSRTRYPSVIVFSPLNRNNVRDDQAADNARIVDQIARVAPVWDFDRPAWLSDRPDLWLDFSHYSPAVRRDDAAANLRCPTTAPADFDRLQGADAARAGGFRPVARALRNRSPVDARRRPLGRRVPPPRAASRASPLWRARTGPSPPCPTAVPK